MLRGLILNIVCYLVLGVTASYVYWVYDPNESIPLKYFALSLLASIGIIVYLIDYILQVARTNKIALPLPRLQKVINNRYIFEPSPIFSNRLWVSLYLVDECEEIVAVGYVESVLVTQTLQVVITEFQSGYNQRKIQKNKYRIVLKPSIPYTADLPRYLKETRHER